jgi:hypothetical protein
MVQIHLWRTFEEEVLEARMCANFGNLGFVSQKF